MPKLKTKRGAAKRFRKTASGKIKRSRAFRRHNLSSKGPARKRRLRKAVVADATNQKALERLLPYL
jgi:large subunit ribosomal protein L35